MGLQRRMATTQLEPRFESRGAGERSIGPSRPVHSLRRTTGIETGISKGSHRRARDRLSVEAYRELTCPREHVRDPGFSTEESGHRLVRAVWFRRDRLRWRRRLAGLPGRSSPKASEVWWRRRELNPRPKARRHRTLHACPLLGFRARRVEAAKYRQALAPVNLAVTRRSTA